MIFNFNYYRHLLNYRCLSFDDSAQDEFIEFLKSELEMYGFNAYTDDYGNLIADRGGDVIKPLIVAHVDINQRDPLTPEIHEIGGWVIGIQNGTQVGCGHDDKAGIYFALLFADYTDIPCRIIFTKDEEVGCLGTHALDSSVFHNISMAVQLDRRGSSDISEFTNGVDVVSEQFKSLTKKTLKKYGYKWVRTMYTDVGCIKAHHNVDFCCMNISCGYYDEHTDSERLNVAEFENSIMFASELLELFGGKKQKHKCKKPIYKPTPKYTSSVDYYDITKGYDKGYYKGYNKYYDYWDSIEY